MQVRLGASQKGAAAPQSASAQHTASSRSHTPSAVHRWQGDPQSASLAHATQRAR
jgi:hypothetical protein